MIAEIEANAGVILSIVTTIFGFGGFYFTINNRVAQLEDKMSDLQQELVQTQKDGESRTGTTIQHLADTLRAVQAKSTENSEMILKMETVMTRTYMPAEQIRAMYEGGKRETREDLAEIKESVRDIAHKVDILTQRPQMYMPNPHV